MHKYTMYIENFQTSNITSFSHLFCQQILIENLSYTWASARLWKYLGNYKKWIWPDTLPQSMSKCEWILWSSKLIAYRRYVQMSGNPIYLYINMCRTFTRRAFYFHISLKLYMCMVLIPPMRIDSPPTQSQIHSEDLYTNTFPSPLPNSWV